MFSSYLKAVDGGDIDVDGGAGGAKHFVQEILPLPGF